MADGAPITEVKASTDEEQGEWLLAQDQEAKAAVPDPLVPWQYRLAKYVVNPVTGPATSSIEEAHTLVVKKQVGATLLPLVTAMWFVLALVLIIGQLFAVYLYYEYRPGSGSDKPLCKKPLYDLCFGIGILGLMGWPIAAINKIPCVARGFRCGKTESGEPRGIFTSCGMMYPFQLAHCVALVLWLIIGIPWLMGIDASKVNDGESLDPMVEPTMCPSDLYLFTLGTYIFVAVGFVLGLCCFGAQLKFKTCPRTFGTSGDDSEV